MRTPLMLGLVLLARACAQQTVAPSTEPVGPTRGEDVGGYNITSSFETGYRFRTVGGDLDKFRSDVNFGNGPRLLGSLLTVNSKDGHGWLFDEIVLSTQGLGDDPYQSATLRIQKNKLYRYDMSWRLSDYYNPALSLAQGLHRMDTERRMQDHDLVLLPQSRFQFFAGYSSNSQEGPALTTVQLFDGRGDEFPLIADIRRQSTEYRLGGQASLAGFKLNVLHGWEDFKDDTPLSQPVPQLGANPIDRTTLTSLQRTEPFHGTTPYWRVNLLTETRSWFAVNGRFTYSAGRRNFLQDESAVGTDRLGAARNVQVVVSGNGRRPVSTGNLTLSVFPTSRLTISNHTAVYSTRMEGDATFLQLNNATLQSQFLYFNLLAIRTVSNTTEANYRVAKWLGLTAGYQYSVRRIRSVEQFQSATGAAGTTPAEQENHLHAGLLGLRIQPIKPLTFTLDAEVGRTDRPFYTVSEKNYHALGARVQYKHKTLLLAAATRSSYNNNSISVTAYSSRARNYSLDASWVPRNWLAFDAGYSKQHLDTVGGIAYFTSSLILGEQSLYISNIHAINLGVRFGVGKRVDLYAGYNRVQDLGDGRSTAAGAGVGSALAAFASAQTFPLAYQSPLGRVSIRLHEKLRWNFGYQHYNYREDFFGLQNYRAHTGYSSLQWSF